MEISHDLEHRGHPGAPLATGPPISPVQHPRQNPQLQWRCGSGKRGDSIGRCRETRNRCGPLHRDHYAAWHPYGCGRSARRLGHSGLLRDHGVALEAVLEAGRLLEHGEQPGARLVLGFPQEPFPRRRVPAHHLRDECGTGWSPVLASATLLASVFDLPGGCTEAQPCRPTINCGLVPASMDRWGRHPLLTESELVAACRRTMLVGGMLDVFVIEDWRFSYDPFTDSETNTTMQCACAGRD